MKCQVIFFRYMCMMYIYMCYNPHLVEQAYQVRNASDTVTNIAKATDMPVCVHKNSNNNSEHNYCMQ